MVRVYWPKSNVATTNLAGAVGLMSATSTEVAVGSGVKVAVAGGGVFVGVADEVGVFVGGVVLVGVAVAVGLLVGVGVAVSGGEGVLVAVGVTIKAKVADWPV